MVGLCVGVYGLLDGTAPALPRHCRPCSSVPALCCAGLALGGRRVTRTSYRPDPWRAPEWVVAGCGVLSARADLRQHRLRRRADLNPSLLPAALAAAARWSRPSRCCSPRSPGWPRHRRRAARPRRRATPRPSVDRDARDRPRPTEGAGVIDFDRVTVTYSDAPAPVLRDVNLHIDEGELCLVVGATGVGQVDPARRDQRPGAALHRRHAGRTGARSTGATPAPTRRANSPTSSAWSGRTRWPASSPTRSRRSSPTAWSSSPSPPP